jgi:hypothetical protein
MHDSSQPLHNKRLHPEFSANCQGNFGLIQLGSRGDTVIATHYHIMEELGRGEWV